MLFSKNPTARRRCTPLLFFVLLALLPGTFRVSRAALVFESLDQPLTADQTAMGGLGPIGTAGPEMLRANPAGLSECDHLEIRLGHRAWQKGLQQDWTGAALPLGRFVLAADIAAVHAGDLPAFDAEGGELGTFRPMELAAGAGGSVRWGSGLSLGGSVHYLRLNAAASPLQGVMANLGIEARIGRTSIGVALRNIGPAIEGDLGRYRLPRSVALGVERALADGTSVRVVGRDQPDGGVRIQAGGRWSPRGGVAILAGGSYDRDRVESPFAPAVGAEARVGRVAVAYGYGDEGELGSVHHLSVGLTAPTFDSGSVPSALARADREVAALRTSPDEGVPPSWSVWMGSHRSHTAAEAEVRALQMEGYRSATIVAGDGATFRIRVATNLPESDARALALRIRGTCSPD